MKDRLGNEVPAEALPFAHWLEARGWHYLREYVPSGECEDEDGEIVTYEGFWEQRIWHDEPTSWPQEEGDVWSYFVTISDATLRGESVWPVLLKLAEDCSEADRISCRVPYTLETHEGGRPAVSTPAPMNQPATEQEES